MLSLLNIYVVACLFFAAIGQSASFSLNRINKPVSIVRISREVADPLTKQCSVTPNVVRIRGGAADPLTISQCCVTPNLALGITAGIKLFYIAQVYLNPDKLTQRLLKGSDELLKNPTFLQPFHLLQRMVATIMLGVLSIFAYLYFSAGNKVTFSRPLPVPLDLTSPFLHPLLLSSSTQAFSFPIPLLNPRFPINSTPPFYSPSLPFPSISPPSRHCRCTSQSLRSHSVWLRRDLSLDWKTPRTYQEYRAESCIHLSDSTQLVLFQFDVEIVLISIIFKWSDFLDLR